MFYVGDSVSLKHENPEAGSQFDPKREGGDPALAFKGGLPSQFRFSNHLRSRNNPETEMPHCAEQLEFSPHSSMMVNGPRVSFPSQRR